MRVPSNPDSSPPPSRSGETPPSDSNSFDKVLERKAGDRQAKKTRGQKDSLLPEDATKGALAAGSPVWSPRDPALSGIGKPAALAEGPILDGLVREILVVSGPGTDPKVEMQFHSTTLEGLNVRLVKKGDEISIRFLTGSDSVARLLSVNSEQLSQALRAKGLHVAPIQVVLASPDARPSGEGYDPRDGRRGRGDERQQKQQK